MTEKSLESVITITSIIIKDDELLRYLHILDMLAFESLAAQFNHFEKILKQEPSNINILHLKSIARKKYMCFFEVKKSLLKSTDFIDTNKFEISNKNEIFNIILRSNITHFFYLLFKNFDPTVPDLQKLDIKSFFNYLVPPTLTESERVWDLYLNFRIQLYISRINKDPQKNLYRIMFPNIVEGPPMYRESYMKIRNFIKRYSEDVDMLMKEFKWVNFLDEFFRYLTNLFNKLETPLLYKYTDSSTSVVIIDDASQKEGNNNAKKRRMAHEEDV